MNNLIKKLRKALAIPCVRTRYFIVFYRAKIEGEIMLSDGQINVAVTGETPFLNREKCFEFIKNNTPKVLELVITNFIEVTKDEYFTWYP